MFHLILLLLPTGATAAASNINSNNNLFDTDPTTVLSLLLLALLFVAVGVLSVIRQCRALANQINNTNAEEGGGGTSDSYQNLVKDLQAVREEHRTNQSEVKAELRTEMDALRGLQNDMATQMVEIRSMVEKLADSQLQQQHAKED